LKLFGLSHGDIRTGKLLEKLPKVPFHKCIAADKFELLEITGDSDSL
jgi:hypothetical protein